MVDSLLPDNPDSEKADGSVDFRLECSNERLRGFLARVGDSQIWMELYLPKEGKKSRYSVSWPARLDGSQVGELFGGMAGETPPENVVVGFGEDGEIRHHESRSFDTAMDDVDPSALGFLRLDYSSHFFQWVTEGEAEFPGRVSVLVDVEVSPEEIWLEAFLSSSATEEIQRAAPGISRAWERVLEGERKD